MANAPQHFHGRALRRGRHSAPGGIYLLTTVTRHRHRLLSDPLAARACARVFHALPQDLGIVNLAWVVMPDHVHCLIELRQSDLATTMRRFKSLSAKSVNTALNRSGPLWQKGYYDHALRRDEDLKREPRYLIGNPVRAGLCERVGDYPYWNAVWL